MALWVLLTSNKTVLEEKIINTTCVKAFPPQIQTPHSLTQDMIKKSNLILNCEPVSDEVRKSWIQYCLTFGVYYLDLFLPSSPTFINLHDDRSIFFGLHSHHFFLNCLTDQLKSQLPKGCKLTLGIDNPLFWGKRNKKNFTQKVSFFGDVRLCERRTLDEYLSQWLGQKYHLERVDIVDSVDEGDLKIKPERVRYWGMIEESVGIFRIQNLETPTFFDTTCALITSLIQTLLENKTLVPRTDLLLTATKATWLNHPSKTLSTQKQVTV